MSNWRTEAISEGVYSETCALKAGILLDVFELEVGEVGGEFARISSPFGESYSGIVNCAEASN